MNGLTLLALIVFSVGVLGAYRAGRVHGRRSAAPGSEQRLPSAPAASQRLEHAQGPVQSPPAHAAESATRAITPRPAKAQHEGSEEDVRLDLERARLIRSLEQEGWTLRQALAGERAQREHFADLAAERRRLFADLAQSRAETARYRQLVIDIENSAPSLLLDAPGSPDDLKLIVGVGPVLERMLHQLGITSYRQIARWTERDVDEYERRLPEFPGRIRRDAWVTQARALHQSKYGEALPAAPARQP